MTTIAAPTRPDSVTPVIPASILAARDALATAAGEYLAIPDAALERPWWWHERELDVRYGAYRGTETIEAATAELDAVLSATTPEIDAILARVADTLVAEARSTRAAAED